jgi:uncharacterized protein (TIGR03000 family)
MQSQLTRFFAVGVLAVTLTGTALVGESSAQWGRFATPYYVNYNANFYPAYPAYVAWRPFGGLFAGIHNLLCHTCWLSPCCCVTPVVYDPCFDPCFAPCFDPCYGFAGGFGYSGSGYYEQPMSLSVGVPSSTGFGSTTPSEGVPGQRPVGVPSVQRPAFPPTGRTLTTSPGPVIPYMPGVPDYSNQPNLAPPRTQTTFSDPATKIDDQLNNMQRPTPFVPDPNRFRGNAADIPPATGTDSEWFNHVPSSQDIQPETGTTPLNGTIPAPSGSGTSGINLPPGSSTSTNTMMNLGTGTISLTVPENAKVYINGYETQMPGVHRRYVVNDLEPGKRYDYHVRIVAQVNGQTVEETQTVTLSSGQQGVLAFGKPQPQPANTRYVAARPVH